MVQLVDKRGVKAQPALWLLLRLLQALASSTASTSRVWASNRSCVLQFWHGTVFSFRLPANRGAVWVKGVQ